MDTSAVSTEPQAQTQQAQQPLCNIPVGKNAEGKDLSYSSANPEFCILFANQNLTAQAIVENQKVSSAQTIVGSQKVVDADKKLSHAADGVTIGLLLYIAVATILIYKKIK